MLYELQMINDFKRKINRFTNFGHDFRLRGLLIHALCATSKKGYGAFAYIRDGPANCNVQGENRAATNENNLDAADGVASHGLLYRGGYATRYIPVETRQRNV